VVFDVRWWIHCHLSTEKRACNLLLKSGLLLYQDVFSFDSVSVLLACLNM
jgi:hypothetical protein